MVEAQQQLARAEADRGALNQYKKDLEKYEDELRSSNIDIKDALFLDRISESLRRMCAYSINMAEVLLNIQAHRDSIEVAN